MVGRKVSECGWESEGDRGKGVVLVLSILVMAISLLYNVHNAQISLDMEIWQFNIESTTQPPNPMRNMFFAPYFSLFL